MPAPRINDELGDELPPPLLSNAHLREHTDKHRSSVPDSRGIYPALFFQSARYVERARFRSRHVDLWMERWTKENIFGERTSVCLLLKKKGKRKNKIIKINLFKIGEQKIVKENMKMSLLVSVFFFFFLKPEIDS